MRAKSFVTAFVFLAMSWNMDIVEAPDMVNFEEPKTYQELIVEHQIEPIPYKPTIKTNAVSRGSFSRTISMEVTAYTLRASECGKSADHPEYGITASGKHVEEWLTLAAPKSIPFGTKVYIPYFKDYPNGGIFEVHDRGGAIKEGHLDVYMEDLQEALDFGRQQLQVHIIE